MVAVAMQRIVIFLVLWLYFLDSFWLGVGAFIDLLPFIILRKMVSKVILKYSESTVIRVCNYFGALNAILLAVFLASDLVAFELVFLLIFMRGIISTFYIPAWISATSQFVRQRQLSLAVSLNSILGNISVFLGALLVSLIQDLTSFSIILLLCAGLQIISSLFLRNASGYVFTDTSEQRSSPAQRRHTENSTANGVPLTVVFCALGAMSLSIRSLSDLFPMIVDRLYEINATSAPNFVAALGIGATAGSTFSYLFVSSSISVHWLRVLSGLLFAALSLLILAICRSEFIAYALLLATGICMSINAVSTQFLIQSTSNYRNRLKALSVYSMLFRALPGAGVFLLSAIANYFDVFAACLIASFICVFAASIVYLGKN